MPHHVKRFLKVNKDMLKILLMLQMFLTYNSLVKYLFCKALSGVAGEADCALVLALLYVSFSGKCNYEGLCLCCEPFYSLPYFVVDGHQGTDHSISRRLN